MRASPTLYLERRAPCALPIAVAATFLGVLVGLTASSPARADGPGVGTPWVVAVGDSYISGEAGRWAGNTHENYERVDALGPTAYYDNPSDTGELIPGCHRSKSAEVYIGHGVRGENLACSGSQTFSTGINSIFKPGIDFLHFLSHEGQALMLEKFAMTHNVKLVPISIGGNNFKFSDIVKACIRDFLLPTFFFHIYCSNKSPVTSELAPANVARQQAAIKGAIVNVATAMTRARYTSAQYTILVQDYPSPVPSGADFRYPEHGYTRQYDGGCGFWDRDADAVNTRMLPTINAAIFKAATETGLSNVKTMNISSAFDGRRLCERGVGLIEGERLDSWKQPGAVNATEWIDQVRTVSTFKSRYYHIQEDLHPNYWGQLALRNCLSQAYNNGVPKGGTCTISGLGLNSQGEPNMSLK